MKCYYHKDADGRCAGAIVHKRNKMYGKNCEFIGVDYHDVIKVDEIEKDEEIVIVDFSFTPEVMKEVVKRTSNIVWIDHHKTSIGFDYGRELAGLRDINYSGCELAWQWYFSATSPPRAVALIGDRDKWAWKFGDETKWFNLGLRICYHQPEDTVWVPLLEDNRVVVQRIIGDGKICVMFRDSICKEHTDNFGFETMFEGHKCFAVGQSGFASETFGERMGFLHFAPEPLTNDEAKLLIQENGEYPLSMDYVKGRACKMYVRRENDKLEIAGTWYDHTDKIFAELLDTFGITKPTVQEHSCACNCLNCQSSRTISERS